MNTEDSTSIQKEEQALRANAPAFITKSLALSELSPTVTKILYEKKQVAPNAPGTGHTRVRITRFYEITYFTKTGGAFVCDRTYYPIHEGELRLYRPNQIVYTYEFSQAYTLDFSFSPIPSERLIVQNPYMDKLPVLLPVSDRGKINDLFKAMAEAGRHNTPPAQLFLKAKTMELLSYMIEKTEALHVQQLEIKTTNTVNRITDFMEQNYTKRISIVDIAALVNLHPNYVHRLFKKVKRTTPLAYLTEIRLAHAKEFLLTTALSVSEITAACGFESVSYFSFVFRKHNLVTPGEFRKIYKIM